MAECSRKNIPTHKSRLTMKAPRILIVRPGGFIALLALATLGLFTLTAQVQAADAAWTSTANGSWGTDSNWSPATAPGSTSSTNNTDIATFNTAITSRVEVAVDSNRNIGGITFNYTYSPPSAAGDGFSLKNDLLVTSGGVIEEISTVTPTNERRTRFQNDLRIQGDSATNSYTVRNNASSGQVRMYLNGVRVDAPASSATTLYLDGSNTAANTFGSAVNDGTGSATLAVVKNGNGYWRLSSSTSTYSGGTTVNAGRLQYSGGNVSTSQVFGTGTLTLNGGMLQNTESVAGAPLITTIANNIVMGGDFTFSTKAASYNTTNFSGTMNLGGAVRKITVSGALDSAVILSGVISNGGIEKTGVEKLILSGHNTYVDNTTVSAGSLDLTKDGWLTFAIGNNGVNNAILGSANVSLDGTFSFDLSGADTTAGNSWNIVNVGTLTETWGGNFSVDGFSGSGGNWTKTDGGNTWTFEQSSGILSVVPEPNAVALFSLGVAALLYRSRRKKTRVS